MFKNRYWSCSPFADWVRGVKKPYALGLEEWSIWIKKHEETHPIRYWLAEEGIDLVQNFIYYIPKKLHDLKIYISNRWITQSHCLVASKKDIPRGQWCDLTEAYLYCMFGALVDFVEIEQAHMGIWDKDVKSKYYHPTLTERILGTWRSAAAGLEHLDWASKLTYDEELAAADSENFGKLTPQALGAIEIKKLYDWYTITRPNRLDPYKISGWDDLYENNDEIFSCKYKEGVTEEIKNKTYEKFHEIEKSYLDEDEEMMIRLIKIRHSLWT